MISLPGLHRKARIGMRIWTWVVALAALFLATQAAPTSKRLDFKKYWVAVQSFLSQYGYLRPSAVSGDKQRIADKVKEAIRRMQIFGGVKPTGIVDASTFLLLKKERCGMQDFIPTEKVRRYKLQGRKWTKKNLTWRITSWPPSPSHEVVRSELTKAFKVWSDVSQLSFREEQITKVDILVSFEKKEHGDGNDFDGRGLVLAHAYYPGSGIGGDAHFDDDEPWIDRKTRSSEGVRLFEVATHEFGHSLGLAHSEKQGALMNPYYHKFPDNFELPDDDAVGIKNLYGANPLYQIPSTTKAPTTITPVPPRTTPHYPKPHTCHTSYDAVTVIRSELYFFKGRYFWRLNNNGLMKNYPVKINHFWQDNVLETVDAAYERPTDRKIVFFSGAQYWLFKEKMKVPGYPKPLTHLGLPPHLKRIDAAMVFGFKTYLFAGSEYWMYDESKRRMEKGYPKNMAEWRDVPTNIDAAFQHTDGRIYFFKGHNFWEINANIKKTVPNTIRNANQHWFGCPSRKEMAPDDGDGEKGDTDELDTSNSRFVCVASDWVTLISIAVTNLLYRTMCALC